MKVAHKLLLLSIVLLLLVGLSGCKQSDVEEEGGNEMEAQELQTGTSLDEVPKETETATFGLG